MSNVAQRLLLFFVAIPALGIAIVFFPQAHHALIASLVGVFACGSGVELGRLFRAKGIELNLVRIGAISLAVPSIFYASLYIPAGSANGLNFVSIGVALVCVLAFAPFAFVRKERIEPALTETAAYGLSIAYPGLLSGFIVLIASEPPLATASIFSFLLVVFSNDSLAWLLGTTLGKKRGIVAVSPNKSLIGFAGGFLGSIGGIIVARFIFPTALASPTWTLILMAVAVAAATIVGDLYESALKRSAGVKDSGSSIPGRGGFLDSFDSLMFASPVFYAFSLVLGLFR